MGDRAFRRLGAGLWALGALLLVAAALRGAVHDEEGDRLLAAGRLLQGEIPARSFVHPDLPAFPLLYAVFSGSLRSGRVFSALVGAGILGLIVLKLRARPDAAAAVLALLLISSLFASWIPTFTPQATHLAAALGALMLAHRPPGGRTAFFAGALGGLAASLHAPALSLLPVLAAAYRLRREYRPDLPRLLAGAAAGLAPVLAFAVLSPSGLVWSLFAHADLAASAEVRPASPVLLEFLLQPQWIVVLALSILSIARGPAPEALLAFAFAGALAWPGFVPAFGFSSPPLGPLLFLLLGAIPAFDLRKRAPLIAGVGIAALFFAHRRPVEGSNPEEMIRSAVDAVRREAAPGETVLAFWPGYAALAAFPAAPGMESSLSWVDAESREAGSRGPRLAGKSEVLRWVRDRRFRLVLVGRSRQRPEDVAALLAALEQARYRRVHLEWDRSLWVRGP